MITAKTNDGFEIELDENSLDYIVVDDMVKAAKDYSKYFDAVDRFLGEENKEKLLLHLADKNGRIPFEVVVQAVNELLTSFSAGKNSASSPN